MGIGYSVIVPVWNQVEVTERCAACLNADSDRADREIIWIDNGSNAKNRLMSTRWGPTVVTLSENRGFGVAMNVGAQVARGEVLVLLNNDTEPEPGMLAGLVQTLLDTPNCGLVVPRYTRAGLDVNVYPEADPSKGLEVLPHFGKYPSGVCYVIRRDLFNTGPGICGFATDLYPMASGEDAELCYRIWEQGRDIGIDHRWCLKHVGGASSGQLPNKAALWEQNTATFVSRWRHKWPGGKPPWTW